jgi:hypothetical protein
MKTIWFFILNSCGKILMRWKILLKDFYNSLKNFTVMNTFYKQFSAKKCRNDSIKQTVNIYGNFTVTGENSRIFNGING